MSDETAFLNKLLELPADDNTRLIYADWLEERGDAMSRTKAKYLRAIVGRPQYAAELENHQKLLQPLARQLDVAWLAIVDTVMIENCPHYVLKLFNPNGHSVAEYFCPRTWDQLQPTEQAKVRSCQACRETVYYCEDLKTAHEHADYDQCVALTLRQDRQENDLGFVRLYHEMERR
jgi:uncharacterized protein (TIGR02996 family)